MKSLHDDLRVLRVGVAHADLRSEKSCIISGVLPKARPAVLLAADRHVVEDGDIAVPLVRRLRELAGAHARQVGDVRDVLLQWKWSVPSQLSARFHAAQLTVGD